MTKIPQDTDFFEIPFTKSDLPPDPLSLFAHWFKKAQEKGETEPTAMTLATVNKKYDISARMVLLKSFDQNGFVFFTNYLSRKSQDLSEVSNAALVFWWPLCQRQIRITGTVTKVSTQQSDDYFNQRDKLSRLAGIASKQSAIIPNREFLLQAFKLVEEQYAANEKIPRPDFWGGFCLKHNTIEFWQGRAHRLHDRFQYTRTARGWDIVQLSP